MSVDDKQTRFIEFSFDENNIFEEKKRLHDFLKKVPQDSKIQIIKKFPPCILKDHSLFDVVEPKSDYFEVDFDISDKDYLMTHNIHYGCKNYHFFNSKFKSSPFISEDCKKCIFNKKNKCRGLLNEKFIKQKKKIIKKRGQEEYNNLRLEFFEGNFADSTRCNCSCIFCKEPNPSSKEKYLHSTLEMWEIIHFFHYINTSKIKNSFFMIKYEPSEILLSKNLEKIIKFYSHFQSKNNKIILITNGNLINEKILELVKKYGVCLSISLITTNKNRRKKLMGYKSNVSIKKIIENVDNCGIDYGLTSVVLNNNIENGDLKKTILFADKLGKKLNLNSYYWYYENFDQAIIQNICFNIDKLRDYLKKEKLLDKIILEDDSLSRKMLEKRLYNVEKRIRKLNDKTIVLCSKPSYDVFKTKLN